MSEAGAKGGWPEFREAVFEDRVLMQRLLSHTQTSSFPGWAAQIATELGYQVTAAEVLQEVFAGRQAWHLRRI